MSSPLESAPTPQNKLPLIWISGISGSGKTYLAKSVARGLGLHMLDLDSFYRGEKPKTKIEVDGETLTVDNWDTLGAIDLKKFWGAVCDALRVSDRGVIISGFLAPWDPLHAGLMMFPVEVWRTVDFLHVALCEGDEHFSEVDFATQKHASRAELVKRVCRARQQSKGFANSREAARKLARDRAMVEQVVIPTYLAWYAGFLEQSAGERGYIRVHPPERLPPYDATKKEDASAPSNVTSLNNVARLTGMIQERFGIQ